ncbi:Glutathione-dependent formaldehyde-activating GFA [Mesorhizobium prunaredense]|uniref:Glutathione-dependent formaldehyde-activating GFA n=1 Tax=Mesorhizobium prunaredense TaxID=1631249 RepID=A0A1R3VGX5_9HYPH|nr:GFA family protein [Mesorhizobium prunaredense]SIT58524.1 Glutathione-dependent formaldehyde-activating GFA [Mesorhizobium prunaredense]
MATGRCLCGGVRYEITGEVAQPIACHCTPGARTSGNFAVMAGCKSADLRLPPSDTLNWYQSSESVQRGFCSHCGGNLFWKAAPGVETYATLGTLDRSTGLRLGEHIYVGSKSDFRSERRSALGI